MQVKCPFTNSHVIAVQVNSMWRHLEFTIIVGSEEQPSFHSLLHGSRVASLKWLCVLSSKGSSIQNFPHLFPFFKLMPPICCVTAIYFFSLLFLSSDLPPPTLFLHHTLENGRHYCTLGQASFLSAFSMVLLQLDKCHRRSQIFVGS